MDRVLAAVLFKITFNDHINPTYVKILSHGQPLKDRIPQVARGKNALVVYTRDRPCTKWRKTTCTTPLRDRSNPWSIHGTKRSSHPPQNSALLNNR